MIDPFANLYAPEYTRYRGHQFVVAWCERTQNPVCYAVVLRYDWLTCWRLRKYAQDVADSSLFMDKLKDTSIDYTYQCGLAYVMKFGKIHEDAWPMGIHQIAQPQYARIVAAAKGWA